MYILFIFLSIASAFSCDPHTLRVKRSTGLGFWTGGKSDRIQHKVEVPVNYNNGEWGCWAQEGKLSFSTNLKRKRITIKIPKSSFVNLPARVTSYAKVDRSNLGIDFDVATFVCLGETVLAVEAFSGTILDAKRLEDLSVQQNTTFATGVAAAHLREARARAERAFGKKNEMPPRLEAFLLKNTQGDLRSYERFDGFVPSVYMGYDLDTPLSNLSAIYTTRVLTKSACSHEFEAVMSPLRIENLTVPKGVEKRIRGGNVELRW